MLKIEPEKLHFKRNEVFRRVDESNESSESPSRSGSQGPF